MSTADKARMIAQILPEVDAKLQPEQKAAAFADALKNLDTVYGTLATT